MNSRLHFTLFIYLFIYSVSIFIYDYSLHIAESKSGKRHSEDPVAGNCRGRKETLHQVGKLKT